MPNLFNVIFNEMLKGNFSFAILVVGILQLIIMIFNTALILRQSNKDKRINTEVDKYEK